MCNKYSNFHRLQDSWGEFLMRSGDIHSEAHLVFLRKLQELIRQDSGGGIPLELFYIQEEAGFFRCRVIDIIDPINSEQYRVNLHFFLPGRTNIHAHGYRANSFVLDGELTFMNVNLDLLDPSSNQSLRNSLYNFLYMKMSPYIEGLSWKEIEERTNTYSDRISHDLDALFRGKSGVSISTITQQFAACVGDDKEGFGEFSHPREISSCFQDVFGNYYSASIQSCGLQGAGGSYEIEANMAHAVQVEKGAMTLFLTHTSLEHQDQKPLEGGEYMSGIYSDTTGCRERIPFSAEDIRELICGKFLNLEL